MTYVIDEPNQRHNKQSKAVVLEDEGVRSAGVPHGVAAELLGLLQLETQNKQDEREDDTNAQTGAPDGSVVSVVGGGSHDILRDCSQY